MSFCIAYAVSSARLAFIMGWATFYIEKLRQNEVVSFRPRGNSMKGKVNSGALVTVEPVGERELEVGDIVLCKVRGSEYLHLIKGIKPGEYLIGNNIGRINGWVSRNQIFGILTNIEPLTNTYPLTPPAVSPLTKCFCVM
jgi:hypothetical protein